MTEGCDKNYQSHNIKMQRISNHGLVKKLEPMLQKPRHWSRCRPIHALDRFIGGKGSDIAVAARSCVSRMPVLLIPRRLAEKVEMLSPEVQCEQIMRHCRPDQIGQSQLQNVSDFRS